MLCLFRNIASCTSPDTTVIGNVNEANTIFTTADIRTFALETWSVRFVTFLLNHCTPKSAYIYIWMYIYIGFKLVAVPNQIKGHPGNLI